MITEAAAVLDEAESEPRRPLTGRAVVRRKLRVDEVHRLDLATLRWNGALEPDQTNSIWRSQVNLGIAPSPSEVYYIPLAASGMRWLLLAHSAQRDSSSTEVYAVELASTPCHFGGRRWWFRCPLVIEGVPCGRRCRVLYRPSGARYFGCRECWRLTYAVRQMHRNLGFEGWTRADQLLEEIRRNPRPRSARKRVRRLERMARANRALERLTRRIRARLAA